MAKETIDYFSSDKSIFDAVISTITNTYNKSYSYLQLSDVEIKEIVNKIIKNCKEDIKEDDVLERIVAEFKKEINIIIRNYDHFTLINNYVDTMLSKVKTYNSAIKKIGQLSKFLTLYDIILDPDEVSLLIEKNSIFNRLLELVAEEKKSEITNEPLSIIFEKNDFLCLAMGVYCLLNNIDVKEENYGEEELDDSKNSDKESESFTETYSGDLDGLLVGTRRDNYSDESVVDSSSDDNTNRQTKNYDDTGYTNGDQVFMSHASKEVFTREEEIVYFDFYNSLKKLDNIFENAKKVYKNELPLEELKKRVEKILSFKDSINEIIKQLEYKRLLNNKDEGKYFDGFSSFNDFKQLFRWAENILSIKDANNKYKEWAKIISKFNKKITFNMEWLKEEIVNHNIRLVRNIALKYINKTGKSSGKEHLDDLVQAGNIGLLTAIERFDTKRGNKFSTHATWWIRQAIIRDIADNNRTIRVPVHIVEALSKFNVTFEQMTRELGREPTISELAAELGKSEGEILELIKTNRTPTSLNTVIGESDGDTELGDMLPSSVDVEREIDNTLLAELVGEVLKELSEREANVVRLRFGLEDGRRHTLEEVGQMLGVTRERIRQIENKAIRRLRHPKRSNRFKGYATPSESGPISSQAAGKKSKIIKNPDVSHLIIIPKSQQVEEKHVDENKNENGTDKNFYVRVISGGSDISDDKKIKYDTPDEQEIVESRLLYILNTSFPYSKNVGTWNALFDIFGPDLKSGNGKFSDDSSRIFERRKLYIRKQLKDLDWKNITITDELKTIPNGGKIVEQKRRVFRKELDGSKGKLPVGGLTDKKENDIKPEDTLIAPEMKKESVIAAVSDKQKGSEEPKTLEMPVISEKLEAPTAPILPDVSNPLKTASMPVQPKSNDRSDQLNSDVFETDDGLKKEKERKGSKRTKKTSIKNKNGTDKNFYVRVISGVSDLTGDNKYKYDTPEEQEIVESRLLYILNTSFPYSKNVGTWNALFDIFGSDLKSGNGKFSDDSSRMFERRILLPVRRQLKEIDWKNTTITDKLKTIPNDGKIVEKHARVLTKESEASAVGLSTGQEVCREETDNKPEDTKMPKDTNIGITPTNYGLDYISFKVPNVTKEEIDNVLKTLSQEEQQMYANMTTFGKTEIELLDKICLLLKSKREKGSANFQRESVNETKVEEKFDYVGYVQGILDVDPAIIKTEYHSLTSRMRKKLCSISVIGVEEKKLLDSFVARVSERISKNTNNFRGFDYIKERIPELTEEDLDTFFKAYPRNRNSYVRINNSTGKLKPNDYNALNCIVIELLKYKNIDNLGKEEQLPAFEYIEKKVPGITVSELHKLPSRKKVRAYLRLANCQVLGTPEKQALDNIASYVLKCRSENAQKNNNMVLNYIRNLVPSVTKDNINSVLSHVPINKRKIYYELVAKDNLVETDKARLDELVTLIKKVEYLYFILDHVPDISVPEINLELSKLPFEEVDAIKQGCTVNGIENSTLMSFVESLKLYLNKKESLCEEETIAFGYIKERIPEISVEQLHEKLNKMSDVIRSMYNRLLRLDNLKYADKRALDKLIYYLNGKNPAIRIPVNGFKYTCLEYIKKYIPIIGDEQISEFVSSLSLDEQERFNSISIVMDADISFLDSIVDRAKKRFNIIRDEDTLVYKYIQEKVSDIDVKTIYDVLSLTHSDRKTYYLRFLSRNELTASNYTFIDHIVDDIKQYKELLNEREARIKADSCFDYVGYITERIPEITPEIIEEELLLLPLEEQLKIKSNSLLGTRKNEILLHFIWSIAEKRFPDSLDEIKERASLAFMHIKKQIPDITISELHKIFNEIPLRYSLSFKSYIEKPSLIKTKIEVLDSLIEEIKKYRFNNRSQGPNAELENNLAFRYVESKVPDITYEELCKFFDERRAYVKQKAIYDRLSKIKKLKTDDYGRLDVIISDLLKEREKSNKDNSIGNISGCFDYIQRCIYDVRQKEIDDVLAKLGENKTKRYYVLKIISDDDKELLDEIVNSIKENRIKNNIPFSETPSELFTYLQSQIPFLKQDDIDYGMEILSSDKRKKFLELTSVNDDNRELLDDVVNAINVSRIDRKIEFDETNNIAYEYIMGYLDNIDPREIYLALNDVSSRTKSTYIKLAVKSNCLLTDKNRRSLNRIIDAINRNRELNGVDGYLNKLSKYTDYIEYIKSRIPEVSLRRINAAINKLSSDMKLLFNETYKNELNRKVHGSEFFQIDILLDKIVDIINDGLSREKTKVLGNNYQKKSFMEFMATRVKAENNAEFRSKMNLIREYISETDNAILDSRFGIDRNVFSADSDSIKTPAEKREINRVIRSVQAYYEMPKMFERRVRCSTFYGYVAYKLNYPNDIEKDADFRKNVDLVLGKLSVDDISYLKHVYGVSYSFVYKTARSDEKLDKIIGRIRDMYLYDNPNDGLRLNHDISRKKPFNQYFADALKIELTPSVEKIFDELFSEFYDSETKRIADMFWGHDHNIYQRNSNWNFKLYGDQISNFISAFKQKYRVYIRKKSIKEAYNKGVLDFVESIIGDKTEIDIRKLEYVILNKVSPKYKIIFLNAFGIDLSGVNEIDNKTYDSLVAYIKVSFKNKYNDTSDEDVNIYFSNKKSVMKMPSKNDTDDNHGNTLSLSRLLSQSIGYTLRQMSTYQFVNEFGLSYDEAFIVGSLLCMPSDYDLNRVANEINRSYSDVRSAITKLLTKVREGVNNVLDAKLNILNEDNNGTSRILSNPDLK